MISDKLKRLKDEIFKTVSAASSVDELEAVETRFIGRRGELTSVLRSLGELPEAERRELGRLANEIKDEVEHRIAGTRRRLSASSSSSIAERERVDVTEPGLRPPEGHLHLVTQAIHEIARIFERIGFARATAPEVEWDWYAFESLNIPPDHPARDNWETFFFDAPVHPKLGSMVLTPHATSGTSRLLASQAPPIRAITMMKTYRRQSDVTHTPMFHQFDGVYVDRGVSLAHLVGVLDFFAKAYYGPDRRARLRPHHFRFTEPSFEFDVSCGVCGGTGLTADKQKCRVCKTGWLELGGAGMLHPNVLKAAGLDPKKYSGLAFGWGIERCLSMKSGLQLDDIRILYKNDLRFLEQF